MKFFITVGKKCRFPQMNRVTADTASFGNSFAFIAALILLLYTETKDVAMKMIAMQV